MTYEIDILKQNVYDLEVQLRESNKKIIELRKQLKNVMSKENDK